MIHILHLSDIHFGSIDEAGRYRSQLETDLTKELKIKKLEYLVISGDIGTFSTPEEYKAAIDFVGGIIKRFKIDKNRVIAVPGNHDLNWEISEEAYVFKLKRKLTGSEPKEKCIPAGDAGMLIRNDEAYKNRFDHFSQLRITGIKGIVKVFETKLSGHVDIPVFMRFFSALAGKPLK